MNEHEVIIVLLIIIALFAIGTFVKVIKDKFGEQPDCRIIPGTDPSNPTKVCGKETNDLIKKYRSDTGTTSMAPVIIPMPGPDGKPQPQQDPGYVSRLMKYLLGDSFTPGDIIDQNIPTQNRFMIPIVNISYDLDDGERSLISQVIANSKPGSEVNLCQVNKSIFNPAMTMFQGVPTNDDLDKNNMSIGAKHFKAYGPQNIFVGTVSEVSNEDRENILVMSSMLNDSRKIVWKYIGSIYDFPDPQNKFGLNMLWSVFPHLTFGITQKANFTTAPFIVSQSQYMVGLCKLYVPQIFMFVDGSMYYFDGVDLKRYR